MDVKIKEFEKTAIEAVSALRNKLGAKRINVELYVDNYESGCKTNVTFVASMADASCVSRSTPACKGD